MNPNDRLEVFRISMKQKYGEMFTMRMTVKELKQHCEYIDKAKEWNADHAKQLEVSKIEQNLKQLQEELNHAK